MPRRPNWTNRATNELHRIRNSARWDSDTLAADTALTALIEAGCPQKDAEKAVREAMGGFKSWEPV